MLFALILSKFYLLNHISPAKLSWGYFSRFVLVIIIRVLIAGSKRHTHTDLSPIIVGPKNNDSGILVNETN